MKTLVKQLVQDESGEVKYAVAILGTALVTAACIALAFIFAPDTMESLWNDAISSIRNKLQL